MRFALTTTVLLIAVIATAPAAAQEPPVQPAAWRVTLAPRFGVFLPDKGMGEGDADGSTLTMTRAPTAGLDVELRTPARWLSLRMIAETSMGSRLAERAAAADGESCGTNCTAQTTTAVGESSVLTLVTDAVIRPWAHQRLQPFAFTGAGVKRYDLTNGNRLLDGGQESAFTFHVGAGLDVPLGPIVLSFEAADYVSLLHTAPRAGSGGGLFLEPAGGADGTVKHDFFLTLGIRLSPH